jgi:predicted Zn-dependent protease
MSSGRRWLVLGLSAATLLGCSDIAAPRRNDFYEWRRFEPSPTGGTDTLSFHWDPALLPVRVWVENTADLPQHMSRAIDIWESVYLYGEFRAELVSDSAQADVIVRGTTAPPVLAERTRLRSALAPECDGATDIDVPPDHRQLLLPIRIFISPGSLPDAPGVTECLALTSIHELGHALGIFEHSPNPTDIMFAVPVVDLPSPLDRGTAEVLYHVPSTLEAVRP